MSNNSKLTGNHKYKIDLKAKIELSSNKELYLIRIRFKGKQLILLTKVCKLVTLTH